MKKIYLAFAILASTMAFSQVGIGTNSPNQESILDIVSTTKGVLIPRVNLTSTTLDLDSSTGVGNPKGLLVFNTGTTLAEGFYFWNGSEWRTVDNSTAVAPTIATLNCANAILTPKNYTSGTPYIGTLQIPYTGGNGGSYSAGSTFTANGLNFVLQGGKLEYGSGSLIFNVTGTPTVSSPTATNITVNTSLVPFITAAQSCTATVGNSVSAQELSSAVVGSLSLTSDPYNGYEVVATTPDGKYSVRAYVVTGTTIGNADIQIRPNISLNSLSYNWAVNYDNGGFNTHAKNVATFPGTALGKWCGTNGNGSNNFSIQNSTGTRNAFGDYGIADGTAIEHRRYTWKNTDPTDKTTYEAVIMLGLSSNPTANATNCPSGTCNQSKVFIKITQLSAN